MKTALREMLETAAEQAAQLGIRGGDEKLPAMNRFGPLLQKVATAASGAVFLVVYSAHSCW
jgi:hypothetical protein